MILLPAVRVALLPESAWVSKSKIRHRPTPVPSSGATGQAQTRTYTKKLHKIRHPSFSSLHFCPVRLAPRSQAPAWERIAGKLQLPVGVSKLNLTSLTLFCSPRSFSHTHFSNYRVFLIGVRSDEPRKIDSQCQLFYDKKLTLELPRLELLELIRKDFIAKKCKLLCALCEGCRNTL